MKKLFTISCLCFLLLNQNLVFSQSQLATISCDTTNSNKAYCAQITNSNNHTLVIFGPGVNAGGGYWADDLFQTNFSSIPSNAIIDSAFLYFSPDPNWNNVNPGGSEDNSIFIQQITSSWNQNTVTFTSEPTSTTVNQIFIPASTMPYQSLSINVTSWMQSWINNPSTNFGIKISPQNTSGTSQRRYCLAASTNPTASLRPIYKIYYRISSARTNIISENSEINIFPNPSNSNITIAMSKNEQITSFEIENLAGQIILKQNVQPSSKITVPIAQLVDGIYIVKLNDNIGNAYTTKFIKK